MIEIKTDTFALQFTSDGKPASLRMLSDGEELLEVGNPGDGFFLRGKGERSIPLLNISFQDDRLVLSAEYGTPEVTFAVKRAPRYLAFRIERLKAVSVANDLSLHFRMNLKKAAPAKGKQDGSVAIILPLDYMTDAVDNGNGRVDWNHLSHRHPENPLGGFALFCPTSAEDSDETVLQIWVGENLPHPKVEGEWNLEAARKWVQAWGKNFADESRLWLDASSLEELYEGARYAEMADVKEIYLFTNVWRGEPFWPEHKINWNINREVFPNGEPDVRAYSDYLKSKGISLKIHYVSGGIGHYDPMYIGKHPDRRLASWGKGSLVETVNPDDTTIRFRPDPGVELPYRMPGNLYGYLPSRSWAFQNIFDYEIMRVEDELIYVGSFDDTDQEIWTLRGCKRGLFTTDASPHAGGVDLTGIITTYGVNFIPENDSMLLREVAENFAGMLTRCGIVHTEYDGAEIHTYNGRMWGWEKFATIVYESLDQPVTALSSSGRPPCCHLEYKMSFAHDPARGRWLAAYLITHQPSRVASTLLDAHYEMSQAAATGVNCFNVMKPEPLFGIKLDTLRNHGLTSRVLEAVRDWKAVSRLMTQEQREEILKTRDNTGVRPNQTGRFPSSTLTHRLKKSAGQYEIVPVHVLRRETGDIKWFSGGSMAPSRRGNT